MREYVWRRSIQRRGYLLHDEGRVADNGRAYSQQWVALPDEAPLNSRDATVRGDVLAATYFTYIKLRFHGLVQVRQEGPSFTITLLGIALLRLKAGAPAGDADSAAAAFAITGGLLALRGEPGVGWLIVLMQQLPEGGSRLMVEVRDYQARLVRLGPASLVYRVTQARVHRWITFGFVLWYVEQRRATGGSP